MKDPGQEAHVIELPDGYELLDIDEVDLDADEPDRSVSGISN